MHARGYGAQLGHRLDQPGQQAGIGRRGYEEEGANGFGGRTRRDGDGEMSWEVPNT